VNALRAVVEPGRDIVSLREVQSVSGEELSVLMPSILDKAFRGEL